MRKIRVLVIDDSAFMCKMISDILESDTQIQVVGTARDGLDGIRKIQKTSPDVVTLDVEMPVMDGIKTLQNIMKTNPLPVVMLSSITSKGAEKTIQAISLGAVDFITKPSGTIPLHIKKITQEIITKVVTASQANVKRMTSEENSFSSKFSKQSYANTLIAIGTSTGGPRALQQVLSSLPHDFPASLLIVQHMPATFTKSLAKRLNSIAKINVKEARHGDIIRKASAYIAPGDYHMKVNQVGTGLAVELSKGPHINRHRPAVDVLFNSVSQLKMTNKVAVVLTGMGKDGADGIIQLKSVDPETVVIAQSKVSSVVYGMPSAAKQTGYVNQVCHLEEVGDTMINLLTRSGRV